MPFANRATAAFLGLAMGDAFGAPLEFLRGPLVCSRPVPIESGRFDWTDDTLMAIYLAEAVLALQGFEGSTVIVASAHGGTFCAGGPLGQVRDTLTQPDVAPVMTSSMAVVLDALLALPAVRDWMAQARRETEFVRADEPYA